MSDSFDVGADSCSVSLAADTSSDLPISESLDTNIEPPADIPVEESAADSHNDIGQPISEPELAELHNEAAALEIESLDEGIDTGCNYDEVMEEQETTEQSDKPSTFETTAAAAMSNVDSPSLGARIIGGLAGDPISSGYAAQLAQMGIDAALPAAEGLMEAAHDQHAHDYERPSFPREGVDFIRNENGEPEPIRPMIHTTGENGESIWVRSPNKKAGEQNDG